MATVRSPAQPRRVSVTGLFNPTNQDLFSVKLEDWETRDPDDDEETYKAERARLRREFEQDNLRINQTMADNDRLMAQQEAYARTKSQTLRDIDAAQTHGTYRTRASHNISGRRGTLFQSDTYYDEEDIVDVVREGSKGFIPLCRFGN